MAMTVNSNSASSAGLSQLSRGAGAVSSGLASLSSGRRINRAADDAAGLGVAENLNAALGGQRVAQRNTSDGISTLQVASGSTSQVGDILKRMRELAVQASSETLGADGRQAIQEEYTQSAAEINRISQTTEFNGNQLVNGSRSQIQVQVGPDAGPQNGVGIALPDLRAGSLGVDTLDFSSAAGARNAIDSIDQSLSSINSAQSRFGAVQNRLESAQSQLETSSEAVQSASSRIQDADVAESSAQLAKAKIMQEVRVSVLAQTNKMNEGALRLIG